MSKLVSMKLSKKQSKREFEIEPESGPRFPHGLSLNLNDESLTKLGIDKLPAVGKKLKVVGIGVVTSVSQHEGRNRKNRDITIQLQNLSVDAATKKSAIDALDEGVADATE